MRVEGLSERKVDWLQQLLDEAGYDGDWLDQRWLTTKSRCETVMPFSGWEAALNLAAAEVFGPTGRVVHRTPKFKIRTISLLASALVRYRKHPAFRRRAAAGRQPDVLAGWYRTGGINIGSPEPVEDGTFCLFVPTDFSTDLGVATWWRPEFDNFEPWLRGLEDPRLGQELAHRGFCRG